MEAEKARLAQAVTDGRLTQAEADARAADLTTRVTERVSSTRPARPGHDHDDDDAPGAATPTPSPSATS